MNRSAHVVGFIDTTQTPPVVVGAGVFSDDAGSITTDQRKRYAFDICRMYGKDYEDACRNVVAHCKLYWPWAHAMLQERHK